MRFPEFSGGWKAFPLSNLVERITRKNKTLKTKLPLTISAQYGLIDQEQFFNKKVASTDLSSYYMLQKGEFAYNRSYSGDYPWGTVKRLDKYDMGALSSLYICFKPKSLFQSDFAVHYFQTAKWHRGVFEIAGEGARNHGLLNISVTDYFNTIHYIPNYPEQEKIATFLNIIDERIAAQIRIIEKLQSLIKGIAKSFCSRGEKNVAIKDCLICHTSDLLESSVRESGLYPVYGASGIVGYIDNYAIEGEAILIIKDGSGVGTVNYVKGKFSVIGTLNYLTAIHGFSLRYLYYCLLAFNFAPYKTGMAIPHIYFKDYGKAKIHYPTTTMCQKATNVLMKIEEQLSTETTLLKLYMNEKRHLLQRMFI